MGKEGGCVFVLKEILYEGLDVIQGLVHPKAGRSPLSVYVGEFSRERGEPRGVSEGERISHLYGGLPITEVTRCAIATIRRELEDGLGGKTSCIVFMEPHLHAGEGTEGGGTLSISIRVVRVGGCRSDEQQMPEAFHGGLGDGIKLRQRREHGSVLYRERADATVASCPRSRLVLALVRTNVIIRSGEGTVLPVYSKHVVRVVLKHGKLRCTRIHDSDLTGSVHL
jgi:hypothetical protein